MLKGRETFFTVTTQSQSTAVVKYNMLYKRVILWKQGLHQRTEKRSSVQVFRARLASFGQLGLINDSKISSKLKHSTSRYLENFLHIDNGYFNGMVSRIYLPELQLNKANAFDTEALLFIYIYLFQTDLFHHNFIIGEMNFILT